MGRKQDAWWTNEIKDAVEEEKQSIKKILQRNMHEEGKARRKPEYQEWKKKVRELIEESERRVDEEFCRKLSENFNKNKKLFWKEMEGVRGGERDRGVKMRG